MIAKEKSALTRRELPEIVILTSKLTTPLGIILTSKGDHLFSSFGIRSLVIKRAKITILITITIVILRICSRLAIDKFSGP